VTPEDALHAAARTVGRMPESEIQDRFARLQEARRARTRKEALAQQVEAASLELDEAAYHAGLKYEGSGDLETAAHWYGAAAGNDFPGASLKLAVVLDALAAKHNAKGETRAGGALAEEVLEWCVKAFAAGEVGASEFIEQLDARLDPALLQFRMAPASPGGGEAAKPGAPGNPETGLCALGGLRKVTALDASELMEHCLSCGPCQAGLAELAVGHARAHSSR
jgi:hypothetical protein